MNDHEARAPRGAYRPHGAGHQPDKRGLRQGRKLMGLNPYVSKVLYALLFGNGITQSEICDAYEMPKQTVNNIVKRLVEKGFAEWCVRRRSGPQEAVARRAYRGRVCVRRPRAWHPCSRPFEKRVLSDMGEESYTKLIALLEEEAGAIERALAQGRLREDAAREVWVGILKGLVRFLKGYKLRLLRRGRIHVRPGGCCAARADACRGHRQRWDRARRCESCVGFGACDARRRCRLGCGNACRNLRLRLYRDRRLSRYGMCTVRESPSNAPSRGGAIRRRFSHHAKHERREPDPAGAPRFH